MRRVPLGAPLAGVALALVAARAAEEPPIFEEPPRPEEPPDEWGTTWGVSPEQAASTEVETFVPEPFASVPRSDQPAGATVLKVVGVIPLALLGLLFLAAGVMAFFDSEDGGVAAGVAAIVMGAVPIALAVVGWRWPRAGGLVLLFPVAFPIGALLAFEAFALAVFVVIPAASGLAFLAAGLVAHRANRPTSPHPPLTLGPA